MRVLVCGGRDFGNIFEEYAFLWDYLDKRFPFDQNVGVTPDQLTIITGMARGADLEAYRWAVHVGANTLPFVAKWDKYGKKAGYIRNKQMLEEGKPDLVIAFPGGNGTAMMVKIAREAGVPVEEVNYDERQTK